MNRWIVVSTPTKECKSKSWFISREVEIKWKNRKVLSLRLKTTIHYSPIHLFLFLLSERTKNVKSLMQKKVNRWIVNSVFNCERSNFWKNLVYFQKGSFCLEIKRKMDNLLLVGVKTTIHLFTYSPFPFSGNKMQKWTTYLWSELKHLFTYSPIHMPVWTTPSG